MSRTILVSGATGKQGGALIQALLDQAADFKVIALTRDASSASAQRLAAKSPKISLVQGNLEDTEAIFTEAQKTTPSIWGVFSVQIVAMGREGSKIEERQGNSLADSALKHGVKHFVYTSSARNGDQPTNVPHFVSKHNIEHHLIDSARGTEMSWTILRPVAFMENFDGGFFGKIFATGWKSVVKTRPLQIVATGDIGLCAAKAFINSHALAGKIVEIAGDELSYTQAAQIYKEEIGSNVPTTFEIATSLLFRFSEEMKNMFVFFEKEGFGVNLEETRKVLPEVKDFRTWLKATKA